MAFCRKCGTEMEESAAFCPKCGEAVAGGSPAGSAINEAFRVEDQTAQFNAQDVANNKAMAILAYIGILFLVPLLGAKHSPYAQFHGKQGGNLCIIWAIVSVALGLLSLLCMFVFPLRLIFRLLNVLASMGFLALAILGIVDAATGKAKHLPVIKAFRILR